MLSDCCESWKGQSTLAGHETNPLLAVLKSFSHSLCEVLVPPNDSSSFGINSAALDSKIVKSMNSPQKFLYAIWWGIKNLCSFGQNLKTSNSAWEMCFGVSICVTGLMSICVTGLMVCACLNGNIHDTYDLCV
ncbi:hypothetical protein F2Q69_00032939 [Brassica cretica]|uniref:Uncharacterized protein n=1 Tax=Brassica cretica TaxID=69181 RepID=A0A8S9STF9_BRACR|nr:hypothetical protein F2Q69_00032939 [Brassica cretica]